MQKWTPSGHVRALGAWPAAPCLSAPHLRWQTIARTSVGASISFHSRVPEHGDPELLSPKRISDKTKLPLPPFLRPDNHVNKVLERKRLGSRECGPQDVYIAKGKRQKLSKTKESTPSAFSLAFAMNPYANALATPVRTDTFSTVRIPSSGLIAYHPVAKVLQPGEEDVASRNNNDINLEPMVLLQAIVSKRGKRALLQKPKCTNLQEPFEGAILQPVLPATYVIARRDILTWISNGTESQNRVRNHALSVRAKDSVEGHLFREELRYSKAPKHGWRDDMPDYIFDLFCKSIIKKVRSLLLIMKIHPSRRGLLAAFTGSDLGQIDRVDNVSCILRLKPARNDGTVLDSASPLVVHGVDTLIEQTVENVEVETSLVDQRRDDGSVSSHMSSRESPSPTQDLLKDVCSSRPEINSRLAFRVMPYRKVHVPVYDLVDLLGGSDAVTKLFVDTYFQNVEYVTVQVAFETVLLQQELLRMSIFLSKIPSQERQGGSNFINRG